MTTVLIRPNANSQYEKVKDLRAIEPPMWLVLFANCWENPKIIDLEVDDFDDDSLLKVVNQFAPQDIVILATGSHPSAHIQQSQEAKRLETFLKGKGKWTITVYDKLVFNPITAGNPRWDLLDMNKYRCHNWQSWGMKNKSYGTIFSSISCPYNCVFCCIKNFYSQKYKVRKPEEVVDDIKYLYNTYGITNFKMMDELFITKSDRIRQICELLYPIGDKINIWAYARIDTVNPFILDYLHKAGFRWLAYGIESGNDKIRQQVMKGNFTKNEIEYIIAITKGCGINVLGNYMFGFWEDNLETMKETLEFAKQLNTEYANFYCTVAYPGSKLYEDMKKQGVVLPIDNRDYAQLSPTFKPLPTKYLTAKEVLDFRDNAFYNYFNDSKYKSMMLEKFGLKTWKEINHMLNIKILRK